MVKVKFLIVAGVVASLLVGCGGQKMSDADYAKFANQNLNDFFKAMLPHQNAFKNADNGKQYWTLKETYQQELDYDNAMLAKFKGVTPPDDMAYDHENLIEMFMAAIDADKYMVHYAETGSNDDIVNATNADRSLLDHYNKSAFAKGSSQ